MSKIVRVYRSSQESINVICPNGKPLIFQNHEFSTDDPSDIAYLEREIALRHPHITFKEETDANRPSPAEALESVIEKEVARRLANMNPSNDMGTYATGPIKPASSTDIQDAAAGGHGANLAARLRASMVNSTPADPVKVVQIQE
jgi:hypothetical protein